MSEAPTLPDPVGLISEPLGNVATEQPGTALFPSTAFEGQDWFGPVKQLYRGISNNAATYGTGTPDDLQWTQPEPPISAEDANKSYGIPGKLTFDAPVPASVAQSMQNAKREEIAREDAAARSPPGFWPSAARMGAGSVALALDPTSIGMMLVPGLGEARMAGMLARAGVSGLGADVLADMAQPMVGLFGGVAEAGARAIPNLGTRLAVRGLTGAAGGLEFQAPLTALRYGLSRQEQGDYSAMDALGDMITMGAGFGAVAHAGLGALGDLFGQRFSRSPAGRVVADDPDVAEAAMRASVAQMVDGRPVEVAPVVEAGAMDTRTTAAASVPAEDSLGGAAQFTSEGRDGLLQLPSGSTELGRVPEGLPVPAGTIELPRGWHDVETDKGGGLAHIEARHGAEIRQAGWADVAHFVADIAASYTEVWRHPNGTLLLVRRDPLRTGTRDPQPLLAVGLVETQDGYRVVTAGRFKNNYIQKGELLWQAEHPAAPRPNGPAAPSSPPPSFTSDTARSLSARDQSTSDVGIAQDDVNLHSSDYGNAGIGLPAEATTPGATPYTKLPKEPKRLIQFLRESETTGTGIHAETTPGGLQDVGGDVAAIIGGAKERPGLINNATGQPLDAATERAWQAGYFPEHDQRPDINTLFDAIREDHTGNARYSIHDQDAADAYRYGQDHNAEIDRIASETGIDPMGRTREQFFDAVADHLSVEDQARVFAEADQSLADEYAEFERRSKERAGASGEGWNPDEFYGNDQARTFEDLENEYRQENDAAATQQRAGGDAEPGPAGRSSGAGEEGGGQGGRGAGDAGRDGAQEGAGRGGGAGSSASGVAFDRALEAAHGAPSPDEAATTRMADAAARDAKPDGPGGIPAALESQIADIHDALARADAAGLLGASEHAEIEAANSWIDQAKTYAQATLQAAACIARGFT